MNSDYCVVTTTTPNQSEAEELAKKILSQKLAACIQIQKIQSFYTWKGEVQSCIEHLLVIKSKCKKYTKLQSFILNNHSYETPEIIKLPIISGSANYLKWIDEVMDLK